MSQSFTIIEIEEAKNILVEIVVRKMMIEKVKNDKDLEIWTKGRNEPNKKDKIISDIINIFARLDGYDMLPGFLMTSGFVKRAPELHDPEDNVENVSHKVKMLETVVVNLANKLSEETRILKEDSKAIRSEIKSLKPSFADLFKNHETVKAKADAVEPDASRERKRSRVQDDTHAPEVNDEVFDDDGFQAQQRRGFLGGQTSVSNGQKGGQRRSEQPATHGDHGNGGEVRGNGQRRGTWRNRLPNVTGTNGAAGFAAPVDLFVYNVNKDVSKDAIVKHMKDSKGLEIMECVKVSHDDARTQSFRIKIKAEDYDLSMNGDTWPYRVRVRPFKHFRQRQEQGNQGQQFGGPVHRPHDERNQQTDMSANQSR